MIIRIFIALWALLTALSAALGATTTTATALDPSVYTDLGAGPMLLGASGGNVFFQVVDSKPSNGATGHPIQPGQPPLCLPTTARVYAIGATSAAKALVTVGTGLSGCGGGPATDALNAAFAGATLMTASQAATAQRGIGALCTVAGYLTFTFSDASTLTLPAYVGWQTWPFAVTTYALPGTAPATCTVYEMK